MGWITKFVDGKNFIDRPFLEKQKTEGVSRKLVRFELSERGIPRHGYDITNLTGETIGQVTSGCMIPGTKTGIGMGYVQTAYSKAGSEIGIQIRNNNLKAVVVK